jgi:hypothetical protein
VLGASFFFKRGEGDRGHTGCPDRESLRFLKGITLYYQHADE